VITNSIPLLSFLRNRPFPRRRPRRVAYGQPRCAVSPSVTEAARGRQTHCPARPRPTPPSTCKRTVSVVADVGLGFVRAMPRTIGLRKSSWRLPAGSSHPVQIGQGAAMGVPLSSAIRLRKRTMWVRGDVSDLAGAKCRQHQPRRLRRSPIAAGRARRCCQSPTSRQSAALSTVSAAEVDQRQVPPRHTGCSDPRFDRFHRPRIEPVHDAARLG
jgi:hypothetical protein